MNKVNFKLVDIYNLIKGKEVKEMKLLKINKTSNKDNNNNNSINEVYFTHNNKTYMYEYAILPGLSVGIAPEFIESEVNCIEVK